MKKIKFGEIKINDILTFTKPETRWLSNMTYVNIEYNGVIYPATENFYQAMKYHPRDEVELTFEDDENRFVKFTVGSLHYKRRYLSYLKPSEAKKFSRENPISNIHFEEKKLQIMLYAQRQKFSKEPFKTLLLNTGDCHLEEGNWWGDKFWGVDIKTREGENHLGKIIMQVRKELRNENKI